MAFRSIALTLENGFKKVVCQIHLQQLGVKVVKTVLKAPHLHSLVIFVESPDLFYAFEFISHRAHCHIVHAYNFVCYVVFEFDA